jgi:hypothetical protein
MTSDHAIKGGAPICLAPETAACRAKWDWTVCGCESYTYEGQLPDGRWVHTAYDPLTDDDVEHVSVGHYEARNCNLCNWLSDDLSGTCRSEGWFYGWHNYDETPMPDGVISVEWEYDYYSWDYIDPRVIGGFIGRVVVARWADDLGLAS